MKTNAYNFIDENDCIFYHAIAVNEEHAKELAREKGYDIKGMSVEIERINVRDQLGRPFKPYIEKAMIS